MKENKTKLKGLALPELRIGDCVLCRHPHGSFPLDFFTVACITAEGDDQDERVCLKNCQDEMPRLWSMSTVPSLLRPINVTKRVLTEIGFRREYDDILQIYQYLLDNDSFHVIIDRRSNFREWRMHIDNSDFCSIGQCEIDYLHQLQNAYLDITGEELAISGQQTPKVQ